MAALHCTARTKESQKRAGSDLLVHLLTAQHSTAQHSITQHSITQHSITQHSTAQHSTAQHGTAQHSSSGRCSWSSSACTLLGR